MGLNPEQTRKLIELMKDYDVLQAELTSLAAMLQNCETKMLVPVGWLDNLKEIRKSQQYQNIAQRHSALIARIENAADLTEVEQLLQTNPSAQIPN